MDSIKERLEAALALLSDQSPLPWTAVSDRSAAGNEYYIADAGGAWVASGDDDDLVVALVNLVPSALAHIAAQDARIAELEGEWQDIATAPKDGTEMIGYRPDQGVFAFRWASMEELVPKDQNGDPTEHYDDAFACWFHDAWGWLERDLTPTHWRPLPSPPKGAE